jgi:WD40 repeat protein
MAAQRDRTIRVIQAGHGRVRSVCWSPDGTRLALGDVKGGVSVWTADGRQLWRRTEHRESVLCVAWSPDGTRLASAPTGLGAILVWEAATEQVLRRGVGGRFNTSVTWSPDSTALASNGAESAQLQAVWAATGELLRDFEGHPRPIEWAAWSPDGRLLASGADDQTIRLWDVHTGDCLRSLEGHGSYIHGLSWSPDGCRIASSAADGTARVWDVATGNCLRRYDAPGRNARSVSFSPDGAVLAAGGDTACLWSVETGAELVRLEGHEKEVWSVAFAPGGGVLASGGTDGTVRLWDVSDLVPPRPAAAPGGELAGYAARQLATVGRRPRGTAAAPAWAPRLPGADGPCLGVLEGAGRAIAVLPGDRRLASGDKEGRVRLWDLTTGALAWEGDERHPERIYDVSSSSDGRRLASAAHDGTVWVWDIASGRLLARCEGCRDAAARVCWSPDGERLAASENCVNPVVRVWEARTGAPLFSCVGGRSLSQTVCWSPDGRQLASGDNDGAIRTWDAASGAVLRERGNNSAEGAAWSLCWSPDGSRLLAGHQKGAAVIWDSALVTPLLRCEGHTGGVIAAAWSPDGHLLALAGQRENAMRIRDAATGQELARFPHPADHLWRPSWSPGGAFVASAAEDGRVKLWDVRGLMKPAVARTATAGPASPVPAELGALPGALGQALRAGLAPPLALLHGLLEVIAGRPAPPPLEALAREPGARALAALRWPRPARLGLALLFLRGVSLPGWAPPPGFPPARVRDALAQALRDSAEAPAGPWPCPAAALAEAARQIDAPLVALLRQAGPAAVAADPALPLRLAARPAGPAPRPARRRPGAPARATGSGRASATGPGPRSGLARQGDVRALVPSQLVLPGGVLAYRHLAGGLLYRARPAAAAPRPRPLVLVLDVSPAAYGPVEALTRRAARLAAARALAAGQRAALVCSGGREAVRELRGPADLAELLSARSAEAACAGRSLRLARAVCAALGPASAALVLGPWWYGGGERPPALPGLRGLFVRPPGAAPGGAPALAAACARWAALDAGADADLGAVLAELLD